MRIANQPEPNWPTHPRTIERLYHLADKVGRARGLNDVCDAAIEAIVEIVGAQRTSDLMFDEHGVMRFKAWRGLSDAYRVPRLTATPVDG